MYRAMYGLPQTHAVSDCGEQAHPISSASLVINQSARLKERAARAAEIGLAPIDEPERSILRESSAHAIRRPVSGLPGLRGQQSTVVQNHVTPAVETVIVPIENPERAVPPVSPTRSANRIDSGLPIVVHSMSAQGQKSTMYYLDVPKLRPLRPLKILDDTILNPSSEAIVANNPARNLPTILVTQHDDIFFESMDNIDRGAPRQMTEIDIETLPPSQHPYWGQKSFCQRIEYRINRLPCCCRVIVRLAIRLLQLAFCVFFVVCVIVVIALLYIAFR